MSQYKFITQTGDMFSTKSLPTHKSKKEKKGKDGKDGHKSPRKLSKKHTSNKVEQIDSVTDALEIDSMIEKLRLDEREIEVRKLAASIDNKAVKQEIKTDKQSPVLPQYEQNPLLSSRYESTSSYDEDEMLNSIIEKRSSKKNVTHTPVEAEVSNLQNQVNAVINLCIIQFKYSGM